MKYVIDASVGFKWAVSEIDSDKACLLRDDFNNAIHELLAPDLFPTEIANALAIAERAGRIKPEPGRETGPERSRGLCARGRIIRAR
jgi:predicted nucleic acid-binding protein